MAVPPAVVTLTFPEAPDPTTAVIVVADTTLKAAARVPPKLTVVAPVKLLPVIVTTESVDPVAGVNEVMAGTGGGGGGASYVNPPNVAVPPSAVTLTLPDAPEPTMAVI